MEIIRQSFAPKITLSHFKKSLDVYTVFSKDTPVSGSYSQNIQSYSFERSLGNFSGSFSFSFKESLDSNNLVMDKIENLDVVHIYEHEKLVFIGIVTDISFSAQSGNIQKRVNVSGKSVEYLFEMLQISLDVTALVGASKMANTESLNISFLTEINKQKDGATKQTTVKSGISSAFDSFKKVMTSYKDISSVRILDMIRAVYGISEKDNELEGLLECESLEFKYPISSQLYQNKTVKFFDFVRNLLPEPVYEIYGKIAENNKPKICIRIVPFDASEWSKLNVFTVSPTVLTSYSFSRSCTEVYNIFLSYLEGTLVSPDFFKKIHGSEAGYASQAKVAEKIALYGFRPMEVTFVGFYNGKNDEEQKNANDTLNQTVSELNEKLAEWFGYMDEMFSGNITIANIDTISPAKIGEVIRLGSNEFYVNSEKHEWSYGSTPVISYSLDRGGKYANGKFSKCENISKFLGEFEKV